MTFTPEFVICDFETALLDGSPSVEYYRNDFRVTSCAFAWRGEDGSLKTKVTWGEADTRKFIERCAKEQIPLIAHNLAFEMGVTKCRFPGLEDVWYADTMRLVQMGDNGGSSLSDDTPDLYRDLAALEGHKPFDGFSLEACASRFLEGKYYKHKKPFIDLMIERGGKKGDFHLLSAEELITYNALDAEVTLVLYEELTRILAERRIDWTRDHYLFRSRCRLTVGAKIRGVKVDLAQVDRHIALKRSELAEIERKFFDRFASEIAEIEAEMVLKYVEGATTEKGKEKRRMEMELSPIKFNLASTDQKRRLFIDKLGLEPKFFTDTKKRKKKFDADGNEIVKPKKATLGKKLLWQFGEAGEYLVKLGGTRIALQQSENLKMLAEYDERYHVDIKVVSTRSGRLGGGSHE